MLLCVSKVCQKQILAQWYRCYLYLCIGRLVTRADELRISYYEMKISSSDFRKKSGGFQLLLLVENDFFKTSPTASKKNSTLVELLRNSFECKKCELNNLFSFTHEL